MLVALALATACAELATTDSELVVPPQAQPAAGDTAEQPATVAPSTDTVPGALPAASTPEPGPPSAAPTSAGSRMSVEQPGPAAANVVETVPAAPLQVADDDPIFDESNPDYPVLQKPSTALIGMPLDRRGKVDWVLALRNGLIQPRANLTGNARMELLDKAVMMKDTREMPWVQFPHKTHTEWLACVNCHPKPFEAKQGANPVSMEAIFRGQYCGMCHDRVAFSVFVCERCHNTPIPTPP